MTAPVAIQLGVALICGFLAILHFVLWRLVRDDKLPLWLSVSLTGSALFSLSLAAATTGSVGVLGWSVPWLGVGVVGGLLAWVGMLRTVWAFAMLPLTPARRGVIVVVVSIWLATAVVFVRFVAGHLDRADMPSWEDLTRDSIGVLGPILGLVLGGTPIVEGLLLLRRRRASGVGLLVPAVIAQVLVVTQVIAGPIGGLNLIGLTGLPMIVVASATVLLRYRQGLERHKDAGEYQLVRKLASGGMGELYLATRIGAAGFRRPVVLKRILPEHPLDAAATERLLDEARTSAALVHPNIVAVHDVGRLDTPIDGRPFGWYIAMELLVGVDLAGLRAAARTVPVELAVAVGEQVCRGLAYAHARGILHRDISPQNVIVTVDGQVKIVDFGIAIERDRVVPDPGGGLIGKVPYLAPERFSGDDSNPSSDLFALGVTLYELLAGERPFAGGNTMEIASAVLRARPLDLRTVRADLTEPVAAIIERALLPAPGDRFPDATAMGDALAAAATALPSIDLAATVRRLCPTLAAPEATGTPRLAELPTKPDAATTRRQ